MSTINIEDLPEEAQERARKQADNEQPIETAARQSRYEQAEEVAKQGAGGLLKASSSVVKKKSKKHKAKRTGIKKARLAGRDIQATAMQSTSEIHGGRRSPPDFDLGFTGFGENKNKGKGRFDLL
jgi:hypothetical protein